ncbi:spermidine synthase, putative [Perkinsus marinus ATCC 50983]|uniref:Spermidine synthase, putative n=1 Tax=Perkinsus marinus (strain ATCC 50983 / TXsc) TaxID=423536 RepID=C5LX06_PERM5|nr:spermidine synthase, putative [Perkinsus marinus ATCC 50983]EEQ98784.1 spermidine synthase, putative [Perkinsus marinus ATCC 50983]|eukprot:XP_002766067.1 spermidine synthase, putative [Perkinsus marinus ATCC 50983]
MELPLPVPSAGSITTYAAVGIGGALVGGLVAVAYSRRFSSHDAARGEGISQLPSEGGRMWFSEVSEQMWPGQSMSLEISQILYHKRSKFQDVLVFDSTTWGRVLCLDGIIQTTDKDEFCYQEAMAHTPAFLHPNPKKVLVIGGGDGGILRELAKHASITELHICEIDGEVIEVSRRYMKQLSVAFDDPRVRIHLEDGAAFMKRHSSEFDIIVCDTSDPIGPATTLFENDFYDAIYNALTPNGVAATQGECYHLSIPLIRRLIEHSRKHFTDVRYADVRIPTYPCGQIGCLVLAKGKGVKADEPVRTVPKEMAGKLKYYSTKLHRTQFTLPAQVHRDIYGTAIE